MADEFSRTTFSRFRFGGISILTISPAWLRVLSPIGAAPQILDPVTGLSLIGVSSEIRVKPHHDVIVGDVLKVGPTTEHGRVFIVRQIQYEADANLLHCGEIPAPIPDEFDDERENFWTQLGGNVFFTANEVFGGAMQTSLPAGTKPILEHALIQVVTGDFDIWARLRTDAGGAAVRNALIGLQIPGALTGVFIGFRDNGATAEPVRYDVTTPSPTFNLQTATGFVAAPATYYYVRLRRAGRFFRTFYKTSPGEPVSESDWTQLHPGATFFFSDAPNSRVGLFGFTNNSAAGIARWDFIRHWTLKESSMTNPFNNVPICIHRNTTVVGNFGAGLDSLHSFSLPAGSLAVNLDYLTAHYAGFFAANDNNKRVNGSFGGVAYEALGAAIDLDGGADTGWTMTVKITRLSSTSVSVSSVFSTQIIGADSAAAVNSGGIGGIVITRNKTITGLSDLGANAMTMLVQGEGTSDNDVVQNQSIIELCRQ